MRLTLVVGIYLMLVTGTARAQDWTPPENPDPQEILREAKEDKKQRRYDIALAKYVWFHHHALEYRESLSGVRLSYALSDWHDLADVYQPAMVELEQVRLAAHDRALESKGRKVFQPFHDYSGISRELGLDSDTKLLFHKIEEQQDEDKISTALIVAKDVLAKLNDYETLGRHIDPEEDFDKAWDNFRMHNRMLKEGKLNASIKDFAERKFKDESAVLIITLVKNDRQEEANKLYETAKRAWDDPTYHSILDKALTGEKSKR